MARRARRGGRAFRWVLSAAFLIVAVAVLAVVAVPLLVSTELVRDRLERDISQWTGQYVVLGSTPRLTFWPVPSITFSHVSILSQAEPMGQPLATADSVTADFSVLSALGGSPKFTHFTFKDPVFTVEREADGKVNWQSNAGHIAAAISIAAANARANSDNDPKTKAVAVPDYTLGTIDIANGTLRVVDKADDDIETVDKLNGTIDWPQMSGAGRLDLRGNFRGKQVQLIASSNEPLTLIVGANGSLTASFSSKPLSFSFSGTAALARNPFFSGKLTLEAKSVQSVLEWAGTDIRPGEAIGKLNVDAKITTQRDRINLDNLIINIDDNRGIGVLDVQLPKPHFPVVAGTLAFNKLNITSFLKAFTPLPKPGDDIATTVDTRFLRQLGLDLRLSAQSASLGDLSLSDLAATARIDQGRASFDVGDASAYGGSVTGKVQISEKGLDGGGMVQASARNVDFGAIFDAMKLKGPLPRGKGSLDLELKSIHPLWATSSRDITGQLNLTMGSGTIPSLDIGAFRDLAKKQRFFNLGRAASGTVNFASAAFQCSFSDGLAEINKGAITTANSLIELNGVIPYVQGSLAMAGSIGEKPAKKPAATPAPANAQNRSSGKDEAAKAAPIQTPPLRFFIGGSWPSPVISPVVSQYQ